MTARWVLRGLVWRAEDVPPAPPPPPLEVGKLIACPTCRARVNQACRTSGGNPTTPHASRLAPRLCECGAVLEPRKLLCESCRVAARARTYHDRERRTPTRQRRKAATS